MSKRLLLLSACVLISGCDLLGIETASQIEARREAEGRAIGSACRHAVRSIEDCYAQNPRAPKAAVFAGWREMDEYMRENEVVGMPHSDKVLPMITESPAPSSAASSAGGATATAGGQSAAAGAGGSTATARPATAPASAPPGSSAAPSNTAPARPGAPARNG